MIQLLKCIVIVLDSSIYSLSGNLRCLPLSVPQWETFQHCNWFKTRSPKMYNNVYKLIYRNWGCLIAQSYQYRFLFTLSVCPPGLGISFNVTISYISLRWGHDTICIWWCRRSVQLPCMMQYVQGSRSRCLCVWLVCLSSQQVTERADEVVALTSECIA